MRLCHVLALLVFEVMLPNVSGAKFALTPTPLPGGEGLRATMFSLFLPRQKGDWDGEDVIVLTLPQAIALPDTTGAMPTVPAESSLRLWVVTGGQTGVDRAALDTALSLFLPVRGWCPKGRLAEDGKIPAVYPLQETTSTEYAVRTEWNVRDSDGTLVLAYGPLAGGTKLTAELAHKYNRPALVIDAVSFNGNDQARFWSWIRKHNIRILNVAGPRESAQPGVIYSRARKVLEQLLGPKLR